MKKSLFILCLFLFSVAPEMYGAIQPASNTIGAPLDGGLLAILAAAGITYFTARKKRKEKDN